MEEVVTKGIGELWALALGLTCSSGSCHLSKRKNCKGPFNVLCLWVGFSLAVEEQCYPALNLRPQVTWDFFWRPPRQVPVGSDLDLLRQIKVEAAAQGNGLGD